MISTPGCTVGVKVTHNAEITHAEEMTMQTLAAAASVEPEPEPAPATERRTKAAPRGGRRMPKRR